LFLSKSAALEFRPHLIKETHSYQLPPPKVLGDNSGDDVRPDGQFPGNSKKVSIV
jgi:hypothetical protein